MLGNKNQKVLPVAFSLMASFTSAILMYGLSAEIFYHSTQFSIVVIGYTLAIPVVGYVYLPVFFKLGNLSLYEVKRATTKGSYLSLNMIGNWLWLSVIKRERLLTKTFLEYNFHRIKLI
jgi:Na+/proline symporter